MWTARVLAPVLVAVVAATHRASHAGWGTLARHLTVHAGGNGDQLLLSDGWRIVRLDVPEGAGQQGPAGLRFHLDGPPAMAETLLALRRFDALVRNGRFVRALHPPEPRADRIVRLLRTADALQAGARQREIAAALLSVEVNRPGWREDAPHLRLQAQRLVRDVRGYLAGRYRDLLRRPEKR